MRPMTIGEVRLDTAKAARFSASALSTGAFDALPPRQSTIYRCPRRPKRRSSPEIHPESGECRLNTPASSATPSNGDNGNGLARAASAEDARCTRCDALGAAFDAL